MKTLNQIIKEATREINELPRRSKAFVDKHVVQKMDYPVDVEDQFTAKKLKKDKTKLASFHDGEDAAVYEETDLDEGISNLSDARLKFHVLKDVPHGSYSKKEMSAEHLRRKKTGGPAYNAVKPSLNEESEAAYKRADRDEKRKAGAGEYFVTNSNNKKTHSEPFKTSDQAISHANAQEDKTGRVHTVHHIKNGKIQKQWQYSPSAGRFASYNDHAGETTSIHEEVDLDEAAKTDDHWVHINHAGSFASPTKDKIVGYSRPSKDAPKLKDGANGAMRVGTAKKKGYMIETDDLDESVSNLSDARLKFHVLNNIPHGSYGKKEMSAEHLRRKKTKGPAYNAVKPSMNEANILPSNFSDRTTPLPSKKAYALASAKAKPKETVSLKKPPFKIDEVSQAKAAAELALRAYGRGSRDRFGFGEYGDDHEVVISPKTHQGKIIKSMGRHTAKKPYKEEVDLDEGVSNLSDARLKFHVLNDIPHGSYSKKEMSAEHLRRKKTGGPAYNAVKPSLNEAYTLYHPSYTDAINTALNHHKDLTVSSDDRDTHIASGPRKPSEGKTVSHNIPATDKSGNAHMIHIQVYNKGGSKPFELNTYSSKTPKKRMKEEASMTPTDMKQREAIVKGMKKSAQDFKDRYGSKWKSVMYATATKAAMKESEQIDELSNEKKMAYGKAAFADYHKQSKAKLGKILSGDKDTSGESRKIANRLKGISTSSKTEEVELDEISRDLARRYIRKVADKNNTGEASPKEVMKRSPGVALAGKKAYGIGGKAKVNATESVDLDEAFKAGAMKLNDGSSVTLTSESSNSLNNLFNQLSSQNKTKMEQRLMSGSKGFNEILAFAKEV